MASDQLVEQALRDAARMRDEGRWSDGEDAEMEQRFAAATAAALRVPRFAERSTTLRRLARVVVPARMRPALGRSVRRLERAIGALRPPRDQ